ncbi:hypothetical protein DL768_008332 [Monosporascus sp. mg162]|nr:hypothetical protein DL768_008332 [Monosporascus sp. mg162]
MGTRIFYLKDLNLRTVGLCTHIQLHSHLLIQPNDDIFDEAFNRVVSRDIDETKRAPTAPAPRTTPSPSGTQRPSRPSRTARTSEIKAITVGQIVERVDGSEPQLRIERIVFAQA